MIFHSLFLEQPRHFCSNGNSSSFPSVAILWAPDTLDTCWGIGESQERQNRPDRTQHGSCVGLAAKAKGRASLCKGPCIPKFVCLALFTLVLQYLKTPCYQYMVTKFTVGICWILYAMWDETSQDLFVAFFNHVLIAWLLTVLSWLFIRGTSKPQPAPSSSTFELCRESALCKSAGNAAQTCKRFDCAGLVQ